MIRAKYANKESLEGLMSPKLVGKYKRCNNVSLSSTLVNINKKLGYVDKTFPTRDKYTDYLNNINLWSEFLKNTELRCILQWKISEGNLPHEFRLVFPDILISNEDKLLIRESYIESCGTLWDIITRGDNLRSRSVGTNFFREIEDPVDEDECLKIMQAFFKWLYDLHQRCYTLSYFVKDQRSSTGRSSAGDDLLVIHGDLSPNNILVFNSDKGPLEFTLIDFDKVKEGDKDDIVREYTQFWSSLDFYSVRDGFNIDPGVFIQMKKLAMENYEVPMYNLVKLHTREDWNVQKEKWEKYWNSKVTEL